MSLPRQLDTARKALPPGFVIVAKFYDVESGRNTIEHRGSGRLHEQLDIPIPRDGGIADLLAEAKRPDRRFVAVVVENIERVARVTYFSTKIELSWNARASRCSPPTKASTQRLSPASTMAPHLTGGPHPR